MSALHPFPHKHKSSREIQRHYLTFRDHAWRSGALGFTPILDGQLAADWIDFGTGHKRVHYRLTDIERLTSWQRSTLRALSEPYSDHYTIDCDIFDEITEVALTALLAAAEHDDSDCAAAWTVWRDREGRETYVRRRGDFAEITYKPSSNADTHSADGVIAKRETNVVLRDGDQADAADQLLDALGMVNLARVEKTRTLYRHPDRDDIIVSIDNVTDAGTFVETEVMASDQEKVTQLLEEVEHLLGISAHAVVGLPYRDLLMQSVIRQ